MKIILKILKIVVALYITVCGLLYFFQEKLIFFPQKLEKNYKFRFRKRLFEFLKMKKYSKTRLLGSFEFS
jgi:hypothetical protein